MNKFVYTTDENAVRCVTACHLNDNREYTWSVPLDMEINEGDLLLVSITVGAGISLVKAVSDIFYLTKEQHEEQIHPYCSVLKNLKTEFDGEIIYYDNDDDDSEPLLEDYEEFNDSYNGEIILKEEDLDNIWVFMNEFRKITGEELNDFKDSAEYLYDNRYIELWRKDSYELSILVEDIYYRLRKF